MRTVGVNATIHELRRLADMHLLDQDRTAFAQITGSTVYDLLNDPTWEVTPRKTLQKVMGIHKVVPHVLNARGLHLLRALLSERIADHVRRSRGSQQHSQYARFMEDGILVFSDVQNISNTLDGLFRANDHQVERVLHMVSGFHRLEAASFTEWATHTHVATDPQFYMHVDTYHPSVRA